MAYYASPFYQNLVSLTEHRVPQALTTTYMDHYPWPYRSVKKFTLDDLVPPFTIPVTDRSSLLTTKCIVESSGGLQGNSEKIELVVKDPKKKRKPKFDNRNWYQDFAEDDPQWKIEGWRAAENFWLRPLSERQDYVRTFGKIWDAPPNCRSVRAAKSKKEYKRSKKEGDIASKYIKRVKSAELRAKGYFLESC